MFQTASTNHRLGSAAELDQLQTRETALHDRRHADFVAAKAPSPAVFSAHCGKLLTSPVDSVRIGLTFEGRSNMGLMKRLSIIGFCAVLSVCVGSLQAGNSQGNQNNQGQNQNGQGSHATVPEIGAAEWPAATALLVGGLLLLTERRRAHKQRNAA